MRTGVELLEIRGLGIGAEIDADKARLMRRGILVLDDHVAQRFGVQGSDIALQVQRLPAHIGFDTRVAAVIFAGFPGLAIEF